MTRKWKAPIALALLAGLVAALFVLTTPRAARHLVVTDAVARSIAPDASAAFVAIENLGPPDRLVGVHSAMAQATLYSPADPLGVPVPGGRMELALDAAHIRLAAAPAEGTLIPLVLEFAQAGPVAVKARMLDPARTGKAAGAGLFGLGDICVVGEGEPAPQISLAVAQTDSGWQVEVLAQEFTFSQDFLGLYHVPGMGHGHLYLGGAKLGRMLSPVAQIGALPKGRHEIRVTLNTNDHRAYVVDDAPVTATAHIEVC